MTNLVVRRAIGLFFFAFSSSLSFPDAIQTRDQTQKEEAIDPRLASSNDYFSPKFERDLPKISQRVT
tara:strand:+ start:1475 stop:1675 length:201 start_codon:yes stop_codon:yes gene_type:complete